jgi:hypothetical protein
VSTNSPKQEGADPRIFSPHHFRLYLKPAGGAIAVSQDKKVWRDTGLSMDAIVAGESNETIGNLLQKFINLDKIIDIEASLPLSAQHAIGRQLSAGLFGADALEFAREHLHLVPVVDDDKSNVAEDFFELVLRLPWTLLTTRDDAAAEFIALRSVRPSVITLDASPRKDGSPRFREVKLPPWPKILIVCPLNTQPDTRGKIHMDELIAKLKPSYADKNRLNRLQIVHTYKDFVRCLADSESGFIPHIVYYYGHAKAEETSTLFQFDPTPGDNGTHELGDLINPLRSIFERTRFPPIIWINACQGGAAKRNNVVRRLAPLASAVITTRQVAVVEDSMTLGLQALPDIALEGVAPATALTRAVAEMAKARPDKAVMAARWATTVIATQYGLWSPLGTEDRKLPDPESAGDVSMRLDRSEPLDAIERYFNDALQVSPKTPHAILWHGLPDDGTEVFAQRFVDLVSERFADWSAINFPVELQLSALPKEGAEDHFLDRVYAALRIVDGIGDAGAAFDPLVKAEIEQRSGGQPTLLIFSHGPFNASHIEALRSYLEFWKHLFGRLDLDPSKTRIVLGLRFVREKAAMALAAQDPALELISLDEVPRDELDGHIERYSHFYGYGKDIDQTSARLIGDHGRRFRPLHLALERKLRINVWKDRLDKAGDEP